MPARSTDSPEAPRTALVTGAGLRLGAAIARHLAARGWNVAVHYRQSQGSALQTVTDCIEQGVASQAFAADFADEAQVRALVPDVVARMGRLDAVVNSAALFQYDDAASFSYAQADVHWRANVAAPVILAVGLHAHLLGRQEADSTDARGVVVNLLDQKLWNQNPDFLSYTLSKAALEAAGTQLALALAPLVRVVGVAPGLTLTSEFLDDDSFERLHRLSPIGRSSTAEDVASAVHFALTNSAITGTTLLVDGGQHLQRFTRDFSMMDAPPNNI